MIEKIPQNQSEKPQIFETEQEKREKFAEGLYVSWEVVPMCDLACPHCYALNEESEHDFKNRKDLPTIPGVPHEQLSIQDIEKGMNNLENVGTMFFNIEGGEPTLRPDIEKIAEMAKIRGMKTILSTHGMYLLRTIGDTPPLAERLCGKIDTLSISLDSDTSEVNDTIRIKKSGRPSNHFEKIMEFLRWYGEQFNKKDKEGNPIYELKINTCVMRSNVDAIENIGKFIMEHIPTEAKVQWKIVQFHPRGKGYLAEEKLSISDEEFNAITQSVKQLYKDRLNISVRRYSEGMYPFVVVGFNGETVVPAGKKQNPMKANSRTLNVLDDSFYDSFKDYIEENPDFLEENKAINDYY